MDGRKKMAAPPAGKTGRPPKVPGGKPTREKILDVAVDLFAERGYDRTTVRDIARAAGITESAVYRHYPGKEAVLDAVFASMEERVFTPLPPAAGDGGGRSVFRNMLEGLPRYIMADPVLIKIVHILFIEMHHNEKIRSYLKENYGRRADAYTEALFQKEMQEHRIRACDPRALAAVFNAFRFAWLWQTFVLDHDTPKEIGKMEQELQAPIAFFEELLTP